MKRLATVAVVLAVGSMGCSSSSTSPSTNSPAAKPTFTALLLPANEVPPITNSESTGNGTATIVLDVTKDSAGNVTSATATFSITLGGFPAGTTLTAAHIHEGASTCACPVVVNTTLGNGEVALSNGSGSFVKASIPINPPDVANRILSNPGNFYFNVHSTLNSGGFARGTLVKVQ